MIMFYMKGEERSLLSQLISNLLEVKFDKDTGLAQVSSSQLNYFLKKEINLRICLDFLKVNSVRILWGVDSSNRKGRDYFADL